MQDCVTTPIVSLVTGSRVQARICVLNGTAREREGIVIHVVVVGGSVPLKKFVAVCLDEVLVAGQNELAQRSDGEQFQRLLRTLHGALEVTAAVSFTTLWYSRRQLPCYLQSSETLKEAMTSQVTTRQRGTSPSNRLCCHCCCTRTSRWRSRSKRHGTPQHKPPCRRKRRLRNSNSRQRRSVSECQSRASANTTDRQFVPC